MTKRAPKGTRNDYIRKAIESGLQLMEGRIILPSGKPARYTQTKAGYFVVSLGYSTARRSFTVGRLVCWLVHGEPPTDAHQVDHINRIRSDDRPENLRWFTASQNAQNVSDETKAKLLASCLRPRRRYRGEDHPQAKLTDSQIKEIRQCKMSQNQLAAKFHVAQSHISRIQNRKSRKES